MSDIKKYQTRRIVAATVVIIAAVFALLQSFAGTKYYVLAHDEIAKFTSNNVYKSEEQRIFVESAISLIGRVNYFWGGKSYKIGWDDAWGTMREVTSTGHSTSGTERPYGLDCSGYVSWCYVQLGFTKAEMVEGIGNGTYNQWEKSIPIRKSEVCLGDIAFINEYPGNTGNHVGICVGFLENGEPLIAHCSNTMNNVVVSTCGDEFIYFRRPAFLESKN